MALAPPKKTENQKPNMDPPPENQNGFRQQRPQTEKASEYFLSLHCKTLQQTQNTTQRWSTDLKLWYLVDLELLDISIFACIEFRWPKHLPKSKIQFVGNGVTSLKLQGRNSPHDSRRAGLRGGRGISLRIDFASNWALNCFLNFLLRICFSEISALNGCSEFSALNFLLGISFWIFSEFVSEFSSDFFFLRFWIFVWIFSEFFWIFCMKEKTSQNKIQKNSEEIQTKIQKRKQKNSETNSDDNLEAQNKNSDENSEAHFENSGKLKGKFRMNFKVFQKDSYSVSSM